MSASARVRIYVFVRVHACICACVQGAMARAILVDIRRCACASAAAGLHQRAVASPVERRRSCRFHLAEGSSDPRSVVGHLFSLPHRRPRRRASSGRPRSALHDACQRVVASDRQARLSIAHTAAADMFRARPGRGRSRSQRCFAWPPQPLWLKPFWRKRLWAASPVGRAKRTPPLSPAGPPPPGRRAHTQVVLLAGTLRSLSQAPH